MKHQMKRATGTGRKQLFSTQEPVVGQDREPQSQSGCGRYVADTGMSHMGQIPLHSMRGLLFSCQATVCVQHGGRSMGAAHGQHGCSRTRLVGRRPAKCCHSRAQPPTYLTASCAGPCCVMLNALMFQLLPKCSCLSAASTLCLEQVAACTLSHMTLCWPSRPPCGSHSSSRRWVLFQLATVTATFLLLHTTFAAESKS